MARRKKIPVTGPKTAQRESKLLSLLPPELRNCIYKLVLEDQVVKILPTNNRKPFTTKDWPGLLLACKQTHFEAIKIYYATSIFEFVKFPSYRKQFGPWLRHIGRDRGQLIRKIYMNNGSGCWRDYTQPGRLHTMVLYEALRTAHNMLHWEYDGRNLSLDYALSFKYHDRSSGRDILVETPVKDYYHFCDQLEAQGVMEL